MDKARNESPADTLIHSLEMAGLPSNLRLVIGGLYRFSRPCPDSADGGANQVLVGSVLSFYTGCDGTIELFVSRARIGECEVVSVVHFAATTSWYLRVITSAENNATHDLQGEFELID